MLSLSTRWVGAFAGRTLVFVALGAALAAVLAPARARACSCMAMDARASFDQAASVFEGRVTALQADADVVRATFAVVRTWKGANAESVTVTTATNSAACGYEFTNGSTYLVYTYATDDGGEAVSLCSRTAPIESESAVADMGVFGAGVTPVDPSPEGEPTGEQLAPPVEDPPARGGCASCSAAPPTRRVGWGLVLGLALLIPVVRRRS